MSCQYPNTQELYSTSDVVECFFSTMRDAIGANFTTKQVKLGFRKVTLEMEKRLDPDLPFYYHTSAHTRFCEGTLSAFNEAYTRSKRTPATNGATT